MHGRSLLRYFVSYCFRFILIDRWLPEQFRSHATIASTWIERLAADTEPHWRRLKQILI
jgi:hypothetical protein